MSTHSDFSKQETHIKKYSIERDAFNSFHSEPRRLIARFSRIKGKSADFEGEKSRADPAAPIGDKVFSGLQWSAYMQDMISLHANPPWTL